MEIKIGKTRFVFWNSRVSSFCQYGGNYWLKSHLKRNRFTEPISLRDFHSLAGRKSLNKVQLLNLDERDYLLKTEEHKLALRQSNANKIFSLRIYIFHAWDFFIRNKYLASTWYCSIRSKCNIYFCHLFT